MPNYKFKAHDGAGSEKVGAAVLADDDEALGFAKRVIKELMRRDASVNTTWMMGITVGKREVARILFETGP